MAAGRAAAFFDLDRTLMGGSSGIHFGRAAYSEGLVARGQILRWGFDHLRFRLRGSTDQGAERLLEEVKATLKGVPVGELARLAPDVLAGVLPRIYPEMLEEVHSHKADGRPTFIVSAAGDDLVSVLAEVLDMDGGIGTRYGVTDEGLMSGELEGPFMYGEGKVEAIRTFAVEHGIDLAASWAYSDSASDLPMLRAVGKPVAVNPDAALARVAREEGWRVMRFEKLGRRLAVVGATLTAAAVGASGTLIASRRGRRRRRARITRPGR